MNRVYSSSRAAYGSIQNLSKASGLSKERRKFLQTKISYTKFGPVITRFRRLQAFSKYINEIWCLNLAFLDKLASQNNGVKYLLFAVDIISRFFRVQTRKTEYVKDTSQAFRKTISRKKTSQAFRKILKFIQGIDFDLIENLLNNGTKYLLIFDNSCEEISNSNHFVKINTAGRHRGLNTI